MATQTGTWYRAAALDAQGQPTGAEVVIGYQYDDVTSRVTQVNATVPGAWAAVVTIDRSDNSRRYGPFTIVPAGSPTNGTPPNGGQVLASPFAQAIPTTAANRLQLVVNARGRLVGVDVRVGYPEPIPS